jgi:hypothetical protein
MADTSVMTSEQARWSVIELLESDDSPFDSKPSQIIFLGGSANDSGDFDLYYVEVIRLMRHYAAGLLDHEKDSSLLPAATLLAGQIPSVVREVVERSKLAAIRRASKEGHNDVRINGTDVLVAAKGIAMHIKLLEDPPADTRSDIERAADRLGAWLTKPANGHAPTLLKAPADIPSTKQLG